MTKKSSFGLNANFLFSFFSSFCCVIGAFLVVAQAISIAPGGVPGICCVFGRFLIFDHGNDFDPVFSLLCGGDLYIFESEGFCKASFTCFRIEIVVIFFDLDLLVCFYLLAGTLSELFVPIVHSYRPYLQYN
jgi:hypothetical protein